MSFRVGRGQIKILNFSTNFAARAQHVSYKVASRVYVPPTTKVAAAQVKILNYATTLASRTQHASIKILSRESVTNAAQVGAANAKVIWRPEIYPKIQHTSLKILTPSAEPNPSAEIFHASLKIAIPSIVPVRSASRYVIYGKKSDGSWVPLIHTIR